MFSWLSSWWGVKKVDQTPSPKPKPPRFGPVDGHAILPASQCNALGIAQTQIEVKLNLQPTTVDVSFATADPLQQNSVQSPLSQPEPPPISPADVSTPVVVQPAPVVQTASCSTTILPVSASHQKQIEVVPSPSYAPQVVAIPNIADEDPSRLSIANHGIFPASEIHYRVCVRIPASSDMRGARCFPRNNIRSLPAEGFLTLPSLVMAIIHLNWMKHPTPFVSLWSTRARADRWVDTMHRAGHKGVYIVEVDMRGITGTQLFDARAIAARLGQPQRRHDNEFLLLGGFDCSRVLNVIEIPDPVEMPAQKPESSLATSSEDEFSSEEDNETGSEDDPYDSEGYDSEGWDRNGRDRDGRDEYGFDFENKMTSSR